MNMLRGQALRGKLRPAPAPASQKRALPTTRVGAHQGRGIRHPHPPRVQATNSTPHSPSRARERATKKGPPRSPGARRNSASRPASGCGSSHGQVSRYGKSLDCTPRAATGCGLRRAWYRRTGVSRLRSEADGSARTPRWRWSPYGSLSNALRGRQMGAGSAVACGRQIGSPSIALRGRRTDAAFNLATCRHT